MTQAKLIFFAGSARQDSTNKKLARLAANMAEAEGASVTYIDLKDYPMPLYDGDLEAEAGLPENAIKLKEIFLEHDGFFIAAPEYNSSISPLLKNTLDWISRAHQEKEAPLSVYRNKVAALGAVAPGALGGLRGLVPLRMMLSNIMVQVVPTQVAIPSGFTAFEDNGALKDENINKMLQSTIREFVQTAQALKKA